jgi:hypothetical protein
VLHLPTYEGEEEEEEGLVWSRGPIQGRSRWTAVDLSRVRRKVSTEEPREIEAKEAQGVSKVGLGTQEARGRERKEGKGRRKGQEGGKGQEEGEGRRRKGKESRVHILPLVP